MLDRSQGIVSVVRRLWRTALLHSRATVCLLLLAAAVVWALVRGLHFYGVSPAHLAYDFDQPPWLLLLVSGWLTIRSQRR